MFRPLLLAPLLRFLTVKLFASHFILTIRFDSLHFSFHVEFKVFFFFFSQEAVITDNITLLHIN